VTVEAAEAADVWSDLGQTWVTAEQDFKPYAVCYWAQPAIAGALALRRAHRLPLETIRRIRVSTFREATHLDLPRPHTTEDAQYSLPFPVAAALVHGRLGADELTGEALRDPRVLDLSDRVELVDEPDYDRRFPVERIARVYIETSTGEVFDSGEAEALWDGPGLPDDAELREKFRWLARGRLPASRSAASSSAAWDCARLPAASALLSLLTPPAPTAADTP